ncbi:MAG TPA: CoA-transferase [Conexibacter sp.]|jgi:glutaconate CoA-transferase subunit A|nr:CoA-transferase [Conexibacter sp.]
MWKTDESGRRVVLASAAEVAGRVEDGMTIVLGGFITANHPMPIVRELVRRRVRDLTVIGAATAGLDVDLLIGAGCVRKLIAPYVGAELYTPIGHCFRRAAERGELEIWESSEYIMYAGLQARAMGQDFVAWQGGIGTSIPELNPDLKVFESPLGDGKEYIAVPAIGADWGFFHVGVADCYGNAQHLGARFGDRLMARAADRVAVCAEKVVPNEVIRRDPMRTTIPYADAVVEAPYGSHPYSSHGCYGEDAAHIRAYVAASEAYRKGDEAAFEAYLAEWIDGPEDHAAYLDKVGTRTLLELERAYAGMTSGRPLREVGAHGSGGMR